MSRPGALASVLGIGGDPAGEEDQRDHLRALGKWRFVLTRGILGFSGPMFLWLVLSNLTTDLQIARLHRESGLTYLLQSWFIAFAICCFIGCFIGVLAWRRVTSEVWPSSRPDPESTITRLGPLA
jgi:hypothetical protein